LRLHTAQLEADEQLQAYTDVVSIVSEEWAPLEQYDKIKQQEEKLEYDAL
jgi:hypothetical protein